MNKKAVRKAVAEARRFIAKAEEVLAKDFQPNMGDDDLLYASAETGAVRRASMDLTRALAEMRKV